MDDIDPVARPMKVTKGIEDSELEGSIAKTLSHVGKSALRGLDVSVEERRLMQITDWRSPAFKPVHSDNYEVGVSRSPGIGVNI